MKVALCFSVLFIFGCEEYTPYRAIGRYHCTAEQMAKVEKETTYVLSKKQDADFRYWYGMAIIRNCELMDER